MPKLRNRSLVSASCSDLRRRLPLRWRFYRVAANLQPAYAYYLEQDGEWVRSGIFVLGVRPDGIASITRFPDVTSLLDRFGAPERL